MISPRSRSIPFLILLGISAVIVRGEVPVLVKPVTAKRTMVVAGHPEAAAAGDAIFREGGNAIDAAVAVSLALGVAEPYGSGLGGKLMLLYFDAKSGKTYAVDAMDEASRSLVTSDYRKKPEKSRYDGWSAVCTPGLAAGLHAAHARWGKLPWQQIIQPAITLADSGFTVLPKTRLLFEERIDKLRGGDGTLATIFLPKGELPEIGSRLPNHELARTMDLLARNGTSGFYRGPVANKLVDASRKGGGQLTHEDLENYEARMSAPIAIDFEGYHILGGPPPSTGASLFMTILKGLESESLKPPLRTAANIDLVGRFWREAHATVQREIGDSPKSRAAFDRMVSPGEVEALRKRAHGKQRKVARVREIDSLLACTTHFVVVDAAGNVVCATQSQSLHFGAGVAAAGVVMNDSMSNFAYNDSKSPNALAPARRPRSTISPTIVLHQGAPVLALGIPGSSRIPTAVLQVLIDHLVFKRPLEDAIGDTRIHWYSPLEKSKPDAVEAEKSLSPEVVRGLQAKGWQVNLPEEPGTGRHFGGINAIAIQPDGTRTGYADPRRTNAAIGSD